MSRSDRRQLARFMRTVGIAAVSVFAATIVVAVLESRLGHPDASPVYLVAVVVSAMLAGTAAGIGTAIVSVLTYDLFFTAPTLTLHIADSGDWLGLLLLTFVAVTVGQLVAIQRRRTAEALRREREAQQLYAVSHALATRTSTEDALAHIGRILADGASLERVWFGAGASIGQERVVADTGTGVVPASATYAQLKRSPDGAATGWLTIHAPTQRRASPSTKVRLRVAIEAAGSTLGSLWGERERGAPPLDPSMSRLLAAAVDQVGQAWDQDRLATKAADVRIAQASDALKSALVESVSHDLRIPLAAIRAHAGPLMDSSLHPGRDEVHDAARAIDQEAALLDRLVANLLDLGRIQGGMLTARLEAVELHEAVELACHRLVAPARPDGHVIEITVAESWVDADPWLLQQAILNVLENAARHTPPDSRVVVTASAQRSGEIICLCVEDDGPGVSAEVMAHLFERFYRAVSTRTSERPGSGVGLAVARGFIEAMGGRIAARHSQLGGLAIEMCLPATVMPAELAEGSRR